MRATAQLDVITRYFLRRLAIARRNKKYVTASAPYAEAKFETILLFVAMPLAAICSVIVIGSLHWLSRAQAAQIDLPPKYIVAIAGWAISAAIGNIWLGRRLRGYLSNPGASTDFDTDHDRRIATLQKFTAIAVCGGVVPLLTLVIVYLTS